VICLFIPLGSALLGEYSPAVNIRKLLFYRIPSIIFPKDLPLRLFFFTISDHTIILIFMKCLKLSRYKNVCFKDGKER
jgi:hypothetical protein